MKTGMMKHWIWTTGSSQERSIALVSGDGSGLMPGISNFWSFFNFLLYTSGDFGYNEPKCAKFKEMRDRIHEY